MTMLEAISLRAFGYTIALLSVLSVGQQAAAASFDARKLLKLPRALLVLGTPCIPQAAGRMRSPEAQKRKLVKIVAACIKPALEQLAWQWWDRGERAHGQHYRVDVPAAFHSTFKRLYPKPYRYFKVLSPYEQHKIRVQALSFAQMRSPDSLFVAEGRPISVDEEEFFKHFAQFSPADYASIDVEATWLHALDEKLPIKI